MNATQQQPALRLTYYGNPSELEGLAEWKQVVVLGLDKFRRHCIEFKIKAGRGPWRKELKMALPEHFDWAFAEAMRLKIMMRRQNEILVQVEVSDDERQVTFYYDRPGSKYRVWITIRFK